MFKLLCQSDPHALGIDKDGYWDMTAFDQHIAECPICKLGFTALSAECTPEQIRRIRRRVEDALRKGDPKNILLVASLLKVRLD